MKKMIIAAGILLISAHIHALELVPGTENDPNNVALRERFGLAIPSVPGTGTNTNTGIVGGTAAPGTQVISKTTTQQLPTLIEFDENISSSR